LFAKCITFLTTFVSTHSYSYEPTVIISICQTIFETIPEADCSALSPAYFEAIWAAISSANFAPFAPAYTPADCAPVQAASFKTNKSA
jgi:hypothetical protein